jgi:hypothetical protein
MPSIMHLDIGWAERHPLREYPRLSAVILRLTGHEPQSL